MKYKSITIIFLIISTNFCLAQKGAINVDFTSENWKTLGSAEVKEFDSKLSTCISDGTGIAYLDGIDFQNGIIECDLFSPSRKAYLGIVFRIGSLTNFEYIYFQPHTSGKWDAVQYDPIFNMSATWQLYNGKSYQAVANIPTKEWFHVKIEVMDDSAKVYLDNNPNSVLSVKLKHDYISGGVGVCSYHPAIFANLRITKLAPINILKRRTLPNIEDETYISNWLISEPYDNYDFAIEKPFLDEDLITKWHKINVESNYLINLNRYFTKSETKNTVLAKTILSSEKAQKKKFHFGYSDKIKVYLNSKKLFMGDNSFYESEKYDDRGYVLDKHETIELPLAKGENELIIEISEDKFGWGFIAQVNDLDGIEIINSKQ
ncbi:MAG: hypothetical protein HN778_13190 [Prolixibacteraceae bacterium]|jgi:hypothetical protein|nr:hypothetical protein [Prolixibacteraceae bacterium]MBT6764669.1 hypothetical protein [Prolixibacteraceae bacterium]MBT7000416.1 hypothetical protein [Prolixibacteraceae bacterium]MBT7395783.1 hypothetical protein [Prolixibacteraceae bacterium]